MSNRIGIIGDGNVGGALASGLQKAGYEVRAAGNDAAAVRGVADWAGVVVLAVPYGALDAVIKTIGTALDGKAVVDATNALNPDMSLALGFTTSGAEELQKKLPKANVVKAFNSVFAQNMATGRIGASALTAFVAGDDAAAKATVLELARRIGFEPLDAGPLRNARLLEPLGYLNIQLGYVLGNGTAIGFKVVRG
jgi:hypothetical protein